MVVNLIALAILLITACFIATLIIRKLPQLAAMDVGAIPEERHAQLKKQLAMDRMVRKIRLWLTALSFVGDLKDLIYNKLKALVARLRTIERRLHLRKGADILGVLHAARLVQEADPQESERLLLEVIKHDHRNIEAYEGLAEIYTVRKEWSEAAQAWRFLARINPSKRPRYVFELIGVYQELGLYEKAIACAEELVAGNSGEPRYLDIFIELAILVGDKNKAMDGLTKLREVNPENAKILDFEKRITELQR